MSIYLDLVTMFSITIKLKRTRPLERQFKNGIEEIRANMFSANIVFWSFTLRHLHHIWDFSNLP